MATYEVHYELHYYELHYLVSAAVSLCRRERKTRSGNSEP